MKTNKEILETCGQAVYTLIYCANDFEATDEERVTQFLDDSSRVQELLWGVTLDEVSITLPKDNPRYDEWVAFAEFIKKTIDEVST